MACRMPQAQAELCGAARLPGALGRQQAPQVHVGPPKRPEVRQAPFFFNVLHVMHTTVTNVSCRQRLITECLCRSPQEGSPTALSGSVRRVEDRLSEQLGFGVSNSAPSTSVQCADETTGVALWVWVDGSWATIHIVPVHHKSRTGTVCRQGSPCLRRVGILPTPSPHLRRAGLQPFQSDDPEHRPIKLGANLSSPETHPNKRSVCRQAPALVQAGGQPVGRSAGAGPARGKIWSTQIQNIHVLTICCAQTSLRPGSGGWAACRAFCRRWPSSRQNLVNTDTKHACINNLLCLDEPPPWFRRVGSLSGILSALAKLGVKTNLTNDMCCVHTSPRPVQEARQDSTVQSITPECTVCRQAPALVQARGQPVGHPAGAGQAQGKP